MGGTVVRCRARRGCARCSLYADQPGDQSRVGGVHGRHGKMVVGLNCSHRDEGVGLGRMDPEARGYSPLDRRGDGMVEVRDCGRTWRGELMVVLRVSLGMRSLVRLEGHGSHFGSYHLEVRALKSRNHLAGPRYGIRPCSIHPLRTVPEIDDEEEEAENADGMVLVHAHVEVRRERESNRVEVVIARDSQENERREEHESCDMLENVYRIQSPQPVYRGGFVALSGEMRLGIQCETPAPPYVQGIANALGDDSYCLVDT